MLRRIAITLATVAAAGLVAATPAVADGWEGGKTAAGYQEVEVERGNAEYTNLGGPYGITYAKERKFEFEAERGFLYSEYLHGR
ncbi:MULTISPECIES: hypothetical protein [unclassified Streptomyces]|uniref:hypothetical protein n=1 Tax=unclassified Streptomyces TaxID=2593676 RepID=UPI00344EA87D